MQRTANELEAAGLIRFAPNPHHQRAKLVLLTARGEEVYAEARQRQAPWAAGLAGGLPTAAIEGATALLQNLRLKLEPRDAL